MKKHGLVISVLALISLVLFECLPDDEATIKHPEETPSKTAIAHGLV